MRVHVLGSLELVGGPPPGRSLGVPTPVTLRSVKLRRLLAALLVNAGTVVSVDRLAQAVWADAPPANIDAALQNLVSRLRVKLKSAAHGSPRPDLALLSRSPGYVLRVEREALDATSFEDLVGQARGLLPHQPAQAAAILDEALALWRGPAFAEFAGEDFARPEAARLEELRLGVSEDRVEAALRMGQPEEALARLEWLRASDPLRERPHAQLLLALYRLGRQTDALEAYRDYRLLLHEELGLEPSAPLQRLERKILRQDPALDGPPAESPQGNLPFTLSGLMGRENELARVCALVRAGRAVTLTGPGGVGKTSLAHHAAARVASGFPQGTWVCELAPISDPGTVPEAVATALAVPPRQGLSLTERLVEYLRAQRALLMLDNCEHVADGAASLIAAVLAECPGLAVLATSREPLRVDRERLCPVPPLDAPSEAIPTSDVTACAAVRLFAERAAATAPGFAVTEANAAAIGQICRRLDGLPLAIELAATRMASMSPEDLAVRLSWRFRLLHAGRRGATGRHRTLRAVVDWSYELLDEDQRRVFEAISAFAGSFTLDAAEAVASSDLLHSEDVAAALAALVDRSMVVARPEGAGTRYSLLETLRAYGWERLEARGNAPEVFRAHAEYVVSFSEAAAARLYGPGHAHWTEATSRQFDDLRAAHEWALPHDLHLGIRLVVALAVYVEERMSAETGRWAERTIEAASVVAEEFPQMAQVHAVAGSAAILAGDLERAAQRIDSGLALTGAGSRAEGHLRYVQAQLAGFQGRLHEASRLCEGATGTLHDGPLRWFADQAAAGRVMYAAYSGDVEEAVALGERLCARAERAADPAAMAWARYALAEALLEAEPRRARELLDQVLRLAHQVGERYLTGVALVSAASLQARHGDPSHALHLYREVIEHWRLAGSWMHQWTTIRGVVDLLVRLQQYEAAAVLYGAAVSRTTGAPVFGADAERLAKAHRVLSDHLLDFAAAANYGAAMTDEAATAFAGEALARVESGS